MQQLLQVIRQRIKVSGARWSVKRSLALLPMPPLAQVLDRAAAQFDDQRQDVGEEISRLADYQGRVRTPRGLA